MLRRISFICLGPLLALGVATGVAQAKTAGGSPVLPKPVFTAPPTSKAPSFSTPTTGFNCKLYSAGTTTDSAFYGEEFKMGGKTFTNYELGCVTHTASSTVTHTEYGPKTCKDGSRARKTPGEVATFADGETVLVCDAPNKQNGGQKGSGHLRAFKYVQQGFECQDTVGTGPTDSTATELKNMDSIEFTEQLNGGTTAITSACVGKLSKSYTVASTPVSHQIKCSQDNPFGGADLIGYGETITFPDRQYEEICTIPNYLTPTTAS